MNVCVCGDWHLGLVLAGYDYHDDILQVAERAIMLANKADLFVQLGDIFHDSRPTPRSVAAAIQLLSGLKVPSYILTGNHDEGRGNVTTWNDNGQIQEPAPDALEPFRFFDWGNSNLHFVNMPRFEDIGGKVFLFVPYIRDAVAKTFDLIDARNRTEPYNAQELVNYFFDHATKTESLAGVFSHLDCIGANLGSEGAVLKGGRLEIPLEAAKSLKCPVFNGHIHKHQFIPPNLYLPGSIVPTDFGDIDGDKGVCLAEL